MWKKFKLPLRDAHQKRTCPNEKMYHILKQEIPHMQKYKNKIQAKFLRKVYFYKYFYK